MGEQYNLDNPDKRAAIMESAVMELAVNGDVGLSGELDWIGSAIMLWYEEGLADHPAVQSLIRTLKENADDLLDKTKVDIFDTVWWPENYLDSPSNK